MRWDLLDKVRARLGNPEAVEVIHGGVSREERRKVVERFMQDKDMLVLIANDAAGEGVNLQRGHLMVNYDLPWNPNKIEQRFGRIHRIGQMEVCHLWNLVAKETREGVVYHRLLQKLEVESEALKGRVFDILGEVFEDTSLKSLLLDAIRYGDQPEVRARLTQKINDALDHDHLKSLLNRNALVEQSMTPDRLFAVKEEMDKAEARRLQPHFVRSFFLKAFAALGGTIHQREAGRMEITYVPAEIRERDRVITGRPITVGAAFAIEATALMALPSEGYDCTSLMHARVDNRARVSVRQCFYSVPARYAGRPLRQRALDRVAFGLMRLALWVTGNRY